LATENEVKRLEGTLNNMRLFSCDLPPQSVGEPVKEFLMPWYGRF